MEQASNINTLKRILVFICLRLIWVFGFLGEMVVRVFQMFFVVWVLRIFGVFGLSGYAEGVLGI